MTEPMSIAELNQLIAGHDFDEYIRVCEARQVKDLSKIADAICERQTPRLVLLAGASSAGKTTTAKRVCTQLRVNGFTAIHFSTDDYFVGDKRNPRDEHGNLDYEHVECVDIERLSSDIMRLLSGEEIVPRRFDFVKHEGYDAKEKMQLPKDGYLVLEGIHALNPRLTPTIPSELKYKMFVEPQPKIDFFTSHLIPPSHMRLLRRLVRDNQFRRLPPEKTFKMWPNVMDGERKWITPFRHEADTTFDSALEYETAVLKFYAGGLISKVLQKDPGNHDAQILGELLELVLPVSPNAVPGDSILRETIGGSQLSY